MMARVNIFIPDHVIYVLLTTCDYCGLPRLIVNAFYMLIEATCE